MRTSLDAITKAARRNKRIRWIMPMVKAKFRGIKNYFGISGNSASIKELWELFKVTLYRALNRRSQRTSYNWKTFAQMLRYYNVGENRSRKNTGLQLSFLSGL